MILHALLAATMTSILLVQAHLQYYLLKLNVTSIIMVLFLIPYKIVVVVIVIVYRYEYKLTREYNWNVKNKASKGYEVCTCVHVVCM